MHELTTGFYKIGVSKKPNRRKRTLQSQKPDIKLLFNKQFPKKMAFSFERRLHRLFNDKRMRGEWFSLSNEDLNQFFTNVDSWSNG
ncbi:MAG: GIY-YIG nuclease family protein [Lewinellaceae bacterium]|nr:GIY-YIG nuclease family protein [Phaeodactylibacter sp.]MCB9036225.1 GIY-YIG nuclease family protein [Lewinellaceae bacterium]